MAAIVVLSDGGLKAAVAAAVAAGGFGRLPVHFLCITAPAGAHCPHLSALRALSARWPQSRCIHWMHQHEILQPPSDLSRASSPAKPPWPWQDLPGGQGGSQGLLPAYASLAVHAACRCGADRIITGLSQTCDEVQLGAPYDEGRPDHRREFVHAFNCMIATAMAPTVKVRLEAPLMDENYADIVRLGQRFETPMECTRTCETVAARACGRCAPCLAREAGFREARSADPLLETALAATA